MIASWVNGAVASWPNLSRVLFVNQELRRNYPWRYRTGRRCSRRGTAGNCAECREVVMITRKPIAARSRVRNVVFDTGAADFAERTATLARGVLSQGPVSAVSCVGVGSGTRRWTEEELQRLEVGVVGAFAFGCHDAGNRPVLPTLSCREHSIAAGFAMCESWA